MKVIVTHMSPDLDAITSVWLIKRFIPNWQEAHVQFVPAGEKIGKLETDSGVWEKVIEKIGDNDVIHVDTGMGPLDHHQTFSREVCAASLTWDYVQQIREGGESWKDKKEAITRIITLIIEDDHFREVFYPSPVADYHDFSLQGILEGLKLAKPEQNALYLDYIMAALDALLHTFENKIWAEHEIKEKAIEFDTKYGKGIGIETLNDTVIKLAQKMGYVLIVRKDPRKGYVRIKARPEEKTQDKSIDLTLAYEQLKKMDPHATWFLHVSKKMLLNGATKNPSMMPTTLSLAKIIQVLTHL